MSDTKVDNPSEQQAKVSRRLAIAICVVMWLFAIDDIGHAVGGLHKFIAPTEYPTATGQGLDYFLDLLFEFIVPLVTATLYVLIGRFVIIFARALSESSTPISIPVFPSWSLKLIGFMTCVKAGAQLTSLLIAMPSVYMGSFLPWLHGASSLNPDFYANSMLNQFAIYPLVSATEIAIGILIIAWALLHQKEAHTFNLRNTPAQAKNLSRVFCALSIVQGLIELHHFYVGVGLTISDESTHELITKWPTVIPVSLSWFVLPLAACAMYFVVARLCYNYSRFISSEYKAPTGNGIIGRICVLIGLLLIIGPVNSLCINLSLSFEPILIPLEVGHIVIPKGYQLISYYLVRETTLLGSMLQYLVMSSAFIGIAIIVEGRRLLRRARMNSLVDEQ